MNEREACVTIFGEKKKAFVLMQVAPIYLFLDITRCCSLIDRKVDGGNSISVLHVAINKAPMSCKYNKEIVGIR